MPGFEPETISDQFIRHKCDSRTNFQNPAQEFCKWELSVQEISPIFFFAFFFTKIKWTNQCNDQYLIKTSKTV